MKVALLTRFAVTNVEILTALLRPFTTCLVCSIGWFLVSAWATGSTKVVAMSFEEKMCKRTGILHWELSPKISKIFGNISCWSRSCVHRIYITMIHVVDLMNAQWTQRGRAVRHILAAKCLMGLRRTDIAL